MEITSYWNKRIVSRQLVSERKAIRTSNIIDEIHQQSLKNILRDINDIYRLYSKNGILDVSELKKAINPSERLAFNRKLQERAIKLGLDPSSLVDERYFQRLSRLKALQDQIQLEIMTIAPQEAMVSEKHYTGVLQDTYKNSQIDLGNRDVTPAFSTIDNNITTLIVQQKWKGGNYSSRIWDNTDTLAQKVPTIVGGALLSGESYAKTVKLVREAFGVGEFNARRLVLTETAFINHQGELQSYIDDGIWKYTLDVTLDGRTSPICRNVDELHIYIISEIRHGINWPPLHPFCRTAPRPVLDDLKPPATAEDRIKRLKKGTTNAEIHGIWKAKIRNNFKG